MIATTTMNCPGLNFMPAWAMEPSSRSDIEEGSMLVTRRTIARTMGATTRATNAASGSGIASRAGRV